MAEKEGCVDLHVHTNHCDGATPKQVVDAAEEAGLVAVMITDHHEVTGIDAVRAAAEEYGSKLEVLPGIELSTEEGFDILGYLIEHHHPLIRAECDRIQAGRQIRSRTIANKLDYFFQSHDIPLRVPFEQVRDELTINGNIAGGHFEMFIYQELRDMYNSDWDYFRRTMRAFIGAINKENEEDLVFDENMDITKRYAVRWVKEELVRRHLLKKKKPCHVPREVGNCWTAKEAIDLIKNVNGVPVIAHPGSTNLDHLIPPLIERGAEGIEVFSSKHTPEQNGDYGRMVYDLVQMFGRKIIATAGSDWHGPEHSPHLKIGHVGSIGTGMEERPRYNLVDMLREKQQELHKS